MRMMSVQTPNSDTLIAMVSLMLIAVLPPSRFSELCLCFRCRSVLPVRESVVAIFEKDCATLVDMHTHPTSDFVHDLDGALSHNSVLLSG